MAEIPCIMYSIKSIKSSTVQLKVEESLVDLYDPIFSKTGFLLLRMLLRNEGWARGVERERKHSRAASSQSYYQLKKYEV